MSSKGRPTISCNARRKRSRFGETVTLVTSRRTIPSWGAGGEISAEGRPGDSAENLRASEALDTPGPGEGDANHSILA